MEEAKVRESLSRLPAWKGNATALSREFIFADFAAAMVFVNRVAQFAEQQNHHPDIDIRYNRVLLTLSSHDAGGVTDRDLRLAQSISQAAD